MIKGKVPKVFAPRRLMAAQALGFRFFKLNEAERAQLNDSNFIYDGMFWDATICAFLCLCPDSTLWRAFRTPDRVIEEILKWADENELGAGTPGFTEIMTHYNVVMEYIMKSAAEPVKTAGRGNAVAGTGLPGE